MVLSCGWRCHFPWQVLPSRFLWLCVWRYNLVPTAFFQFLPDLSEEFVPPTPPSWGHSEGSVLSSTCNCGSLWKRPAREVGRPGLLCAPYAFGSQSGVLRSLFLIIIVHIFAFRAAQREPAGGGSKSSFNFHCDGLLLHLKWCLICTRALRL